jgi:hypothetical protein
MQNSMKKSAPHSSKNMQNSINKKELKLIARKMQNSMKKVRTQ